VASTVRRPVLTVAAAWVTAAEGGKLARPCGCRCLVHPRARHRVASTSPPSAVSFGDFSGG